MSVFSIFHADYFKNRKTIRDINLQGTDIFAHFCIFMYKNPKGTKAVVSAVGVLPEVVEAVLLLKFPPTRLISDHTDKI
ncbi:hypothetical protein WN51_06064 [Melipona quadrifasciata]|uniref:Uncharacterized protein n=1 Tax=Melipona quadrifasciata TaxID=166423 RepID=A0A0M8ZNZ9_9HYME|nr:hypothetical protein WN51_06064 [Melipona quadrifasciata]